MKQTAIFRSTHISLIGSTAMSMMCMMPCCACIKRERSRARLVQGWR